MSQTEVSVSFMGDWRLAAALARALPSYGSRVATMVYEVVLPILFLLKRDTRRANVIHFTDLGFVVPSVFVAFLLNRRIAVTIQSLGGLADFSRSNPNLRHSFFDSIYRLQLRIGLRLASRLSRVLLPVSGLIQAELTKLGVQCSMAVVYPFFKTGQKDAKTKTGSLVLGFVGALVPWKRVERAIRVLGILKENGLSCSLIIVGTGPSKSSLISYVRDIGLSSDVEFAGHVTDGLERFYKNFFFLILTSRFESFGYPVMEAASVGTPVISFSDALLDIEIRSLTLVAGSEKEAAGIIERIWKNGAAYDELSTQVSRKSRMLAKENATSRLTALYASLQKVPCRSHPCHVGWRESHVPVRLH